MSNRGLSFKARVQFVVHVPRLFDKQTVPLEVRNGYVDTAAWLGTDPYSVRLSAAFATLVASSKDCHKWACGERSAKKFRRPNRLQLLVPNSPQWFTTHRCGLSGMSHGTYLFGSAAFFAPGAIGNVELVLFVATLLVNPLKETGQLQLTFRGVACCVLQQLAAKFVSDVGAFCDVIDKPTEDLVLRTASGNCRRFDSQLKASIVAECESGKVPMFLLVGACVCHKLALSSCSGGPPFTKAT
jgi:hypothetical protein